MDQLQREIAACRACPRLVAWREKVAESKVKRFANETYWGRPVPGFGDSQARVAILGLAPAAHGANRTGRMFTGDASGDWLFSALYQTGFARKPHSTNRYDGQQLSDVFITAALHCAPPLNKPTADELKRCASFWQRELHMLPNLRVVICLGRIAFDQFKRAHHLRRLPFGHDVLHAIEAPPLWLLCSYHPSRQNTQTGRLPWKDWLAIFQKTRSLIET